MLKISSVPDGFKDEADAADRILKAMLRLRELGDGWYLDISYDYEYDCWMYKFIHVVEELSGFENIIFIEAN